MRRVIGALGALAFVLIGFPALASCPATATDCPSPTFNNLTVGGTTSGVFGGLGLGLAPGSTVLVSGGSGYALGDTITLTCAGCSIITNPIATVNAVSGNVITGATITTNGSLTAAPNSVAGLAFTQAATSGGGSGASFTAKLAPIASGLSVPSLGTGGGNANGNFFLGAEQTLNGLYGAENTLIGDRAGGKFTGAAAANTALGHDACGIFGAVAPSGSYNTCIGNDAGRDISGTAAANTLVGQAAGTALSGSFNEFIGESAGSSVTTGAFNLFLGYQVGSTTALSGQDNVLIGPTGLADLPTSSTNNYIGIFGNNATPIFSATGTDVPATSVSKIAGAFAVAGGSFAQTLSFGQLTGNTALIGFGPTGAAQAQISTSNYAFLADGTQTLFNAGTNHSFRIGNTEALGVTATLASLNTGQLQLTNVTSNLLFYLGAGAGLPTFTSRSVGTKIVLFPQLDGTNVDYGIGIAGNTIWFSLPQSGAGNRFEWYGGTTKVASLDDTGVLSVAGYKTGSTTGVTCSGSPTVSFASTLGIVTHC